MSDRACNSKNKIISSNKMADCWKEFVFSRQERYNDLFNENIKNIILEKIEDEVFADFLISSINDFESKVAFVNYNRGFRDALKFSKMLDKD